MFARLKGEAEGIIDHVIELVYHMKGSVGYEEMMRRTFAERQRFEEFIIKTLERESAAKTGKKVVSA